ncbi:unnamed protein product, partial [Rotaria sp. Silwood1]
RPPATRPPSQPLAPPATRPDDSHDAELSPPPRARPASTTSAPQAKRRTLLQRAAPPPPYPAPRNVIIQYEQAPVRVVRQFQRL